MTVYCFGLTCTMLQWSESIFTVWSILFSKTTWSLSKIFALFVILSILYNLSTGLYTTVIALASFNFPPITWSLSLFTLTKLKDDQDILSSIITGHQLSSWDGFLPCYFVKIFCAKFTPWKRQNELCNHFVEGHPSNIKF